jgi:hypothetical protein
MTSCSNTKECGASSAKPEKKEEAKAQKSAPATTKPAEAKPAAEKPTEAKPADDFSNSWGWRVDLVATQHIPS